LKNYCRLAGRMATAIQPPNGLAQKNIANRLYFGKPV